MLTHPTVVVFDDRHGSRHLLSVHSCAHEGVVAALHRVAASLHRSELETGQCSPEKKQEAPRTAIRKASTAHILRSQEARAAGAQSDTNVRR